VLQLLGNLGQRLVVLLGDPGAGKSTLVRYLALALVGEEGVEELSALAGWLPLLVELRSYAEPRWLDSTFLDFLHHLHATEGLGLPKEALEGYLHSDGRAVVLFDGLDEIFDRAGRETVARQIAAFAARYPKTRIVVTSRKIGYRESVLADAQFAHHTLQDLDRAQIEQFVRSWYELACPDDPAEADRRRRRILAALDASTSIQDLAGNPLLLTILAIIGRRQELPRDRRNVYQHAAAVLVEHWDFERDVRAARIELSYVSHEDKLELLERVARRMQDSEAGLGGNHIAGADLLSEFEDYLEKTYELTPVQAKPAARAMLNQFRERNFILSHFGAEVYGFVHRAFLEYFSAADIVRRFHRREWTPDELVSDIFGRRWADPNWQEVLLLVAGMIDERFTGSAIDWLLRANELWFVEPEGTPQHVLLAVRCLGEVRKLGMLPQQCRDITEAIILLLETAHLQERELYQYGRASATAKTLQKTTLPVFEALGPRWPEGARYWTWYRTLGWRRSSPWYLSSSVRRVAARIAAAMCSGDSEVKAAMCADVTFGDGGTREAAVGALAVGWGKDPDIQRLIQNVAMTDTQWDVRDAAVEAILDQEIGADTLSVLCDVAGTDTDEGVQRTAIEALASRWSDEPRTLPLLRDLTTHVDPDIRTAAVDALASGWPEDPIVGQALRQLATADLHPDVREAAVRAVFAVGRDEPDTASWLRERATMDSSPQVRGAAVEALAEGRPDEADSVRWLREHAGSDPSTEVRQAVVEALGAGRQRDPDTSEWLREQAIGPDVKMHVTALEALAAGWRDDPDTVALLRDRAVTETDEEAAEAAMDALAQRYREEADTAPLLKELAATHPNPAMRQSAVEALATGWPTDPEILQWLRTSPAADDPVDHVRNAAIQAIAEAQPRDPDTHQWLRNRAGAALDPTTRQLAVQAVAVAGHPDPETAEWLRERVTADPDARVRLAALLALIAGWRTDKQTAEWLFELAATGLDPFVRRAAMERYSTHWRTAPATRRILDDRMLNDPDEEVRITAIDGLCLGWSGDPAALKALREHATEDSYRVRVAAIEALGVGWRDSPDTAPLLCKRAIADEHQDAREAAIRALCCGWQEDPPTLPLLRERATTDPHQDVRKAALEALYAGWRQDPATLPLLRDRATTDPHQDIRKAALEALYAGWRQDPATLPLLRDRATTDPHRDVRKAALSALYAGWRELPLATLREVVTSDPDESDRQGALLAIAMAGRDDPNTHRLLRERAVADPEPEIRAAALETLCAGWPGAPETGSLLSHIAETDPDEDARAAAAQARTIQARASVGTGGRVDNRRPGLNQLAQGGIKPESQLDQVQDTP
jgi:HEAT repeat protein/energy-coupling factor transporter ATP-binding protein EcfA2